MAETSEAFKFFLDGVELIHHPKGWEDFKASINRNISRRSLLIKFPSSLTFWGDGYDLIRSKYLENGYCAELAFVVQKLCSGVVTRTFNGIVFVSDVKPFDLDKCTATVEVKDNNFAARIENNREIQAKFDAPKSKNDVTISAATAFSLFLFDTEGVYSGAGVSKLFNDGNRRAYDWKKAMEFILRFMTDGQVGFRSDWYDNFTSKRTTPGVDGICIVDGFEMRIGSGGFGNPDMSFNEIFYPVAKLYNLWFTIETDSTGTFLRVEQESYFQNTEVILTLDKVKGVEQLFAQQLLYAKIKLGSQETAKVGTLTDLPPNGSTGTLPTVRFQGFIKEEYQIEGKCNIKTTLDLSVDIIIDNNIIEDSIMNDEDSYDEDNFLIDYDRIGRFAHRYDPFNLDPALGSHTYNRDFMNDLVSTRYDLQGNITKYFGDGNDECDIIRTSDPIITFTNPPAGFPSIAIINITVTPYEFENELSDTNNRYDNVLFRYTVPFNGIYTFEAKVITQILTIDPGGAFAQLENLQSIIDLRRFDSLNNFLGQVADFSQSRWAVESIPHEQIVTGTFYANAADYIILRWQGNFKLSDGISATVKLNKDSTFKCVATTNGGGLFDPKDAQDYFTSLYKFEKYLSDEQINTLLGAPHKAIQFNRDGENNIKTWINNTSVNLYDGKTDWEQISNLTPVV